ncbi:hypothetical protein SAMN04487907_10867 [Zunongwangia mangrovi]|uniref:Fucosyltransferase C-terminal domain-containing protein n=1 Tax=Zunongwangia mangrovi TaxID=1334022 RepID=A0A1I1LNX8_9FLAO|nr:glycosyltransferase family 10 [Zunongwangia mangrovi]SFC74242.1 hypothetical protein SAMN04487907_10867 [Zunongwangia mangrovi]
MIKIFKASKMAYTPFDNFEEGDFNIFEQYNIKFVENVQDADIIVSDTIRHLKKYFFRGLSGMKFLLWTNEPRFDLSFTEVTRHFGFIKVHHMNIYTKDVFLQNLSFHAKMMNRSLNYLGNEFRFKSKKTVALMSYYNGINAPKLIFNRKNIDLIGLRSEIALVGDKLGVLDVYGKGWPNNIAIEDSRTGGWPTRKKEILSNYNFNLCFENTAFPNYMTEKIWNSIENYCLPIYYSENTNAYELFPKQSFIDYADFKDAEELFSFINALSKDEYRLRLNKCIKVYNSIFERGQKYAKILRQEVLEMVVKRLKSIKENKNVN